MQRQVVCLSDLHLGHRRNDSVLMVKAIDENLLTSGLLQRTNLLFLAGDVFDRLLELNYPALGEIDHWIRRLFDACQKYGIVMRVLEGTPSHDRRQSKRFDVVYKLTNSKCDFRYVEEIEIEYIESLQTSVLYIPDEINPTTQETREVVMTLLKARGLEQVDLCCMHGFFAYQIPHQFKEHAYHDAEYYQSITKYWVFIGHVHTHTRLGKIIAQGSHDRLSHGEEEPKGLVAATWGGDSDECWFIENKLAHVYKTIVCYDMEMADVFELVERTLKEVPDFSRIRIEAEPTHPVFEHMVELQKKHPTMNFTKHPKALGEKDPLQAAAEENELNRWHPVHIDKENIQALLTDRFLQKGIDQNTAQRALRHLGELLL